MKTGATRIMLLTGLLASGGSVFCFSPVLAASDNSNREARIESRREAGETNDEQRPEQQPSRNGSGLGRRGHVR